jgi:amidase
VPPFPGNRADIMNAAIDQMRAQGAYVEIIEPLAPQLGICVSLPAPVTCSTVLLYGQKRDMNAYLATRPGAPVDSLSEIIAANNVIPGSLKYGQAIFEAADMLDLSPGSPDTVRYLQDRAEDLVRSRGALDGVYAGSDGVSGTADDFDAILLSGNNQAGTAAKAGYPSVSVPGGFLPPSGDIMNPFPSNVTFTGPAFSEPRLIALAYAFEQATRHRVPPASTPPLATDTVGRP